MRWTLSQLRRALRGHAAIGGDPVVARLGPGCRVDVTRLLDGRDGGPGDGAAGDLDLPEVLLDGADGIAGPDFDLWLTAARHRVDAACGARLRRAAERALAAAEPSIAVTAAARALVAEPDQAAARATLVGSLVAAGDHAAALAQLRQWSAWIRQELRIGRLMGDTRGDGQGPPSGDPTSSAGSKPGRRPWPRAPCRRASSTCATRRGWPPGAPTNGSTPPRCSPSAAAWCTRWRRTRSRAPRRCGRRPGWRGGQADHRLVAEALRDLAYVENASGRVEPTRRLLSAAAAAAGGDAGALSSVRAIEGMFLADRGAHGRALRALRESAHLAESTGRTRQAAWSLSIASRSLLQQGELDGAAEYAEQCLQLAVEERWTAMLPWMQAILADLDLANGRVGQAERRLRHAWSLGLVLNDWCWQAMAARGLGLAAFARGDLPGALRWLEEAGRRAAHDHDRYAWIHAWTQEATCRVTVATRLPRAKADVSLLAALAAGSQQPEFAARANLHRSALGASSAR